MKENKESPVDLPKVLQITQYSLHLFLEDIQKAFDKGYKIDLSKPEGFPEHYLTEYSIKLFLNKKSKAVPE